MEHIFNILIFGLLAIQIFRIAILEKRFGKDKAYFLASLMLLPVVVYVAMQFFCMSSKGYTELGILTTAMVLIHIIYSIYIMRFKS